jgi:hypothetical protein
LTVGRRKVGGERREVGSGRREERGERWEVEEERREERGAYRVWYA